jgi:hypothetical protein
MFDDNIADLLECLCDCETHFECEWHRRLSGTDTRGIVDRRELEDDMEAELERRHWYFIHGYDRDAPIHPEELRDTENKEVDL